MSHATFVVLLMTFLAVNLVAALAASYVGSRKATRLQCKALRPEKLRASFREPLSMARSRRFAA